MMDNISKNIANLPQQLAALQEAQAAAAKKAQEEAAKTAAALQNASLTNLFASIPDPDARDFWKKSFGQVRGVSVTHCIDNFSGSISVQRTDDSTTTQCVHFLC
jgi:hypothetical protein